MFVIQFISKLIKILRSAASPPQIAGGFILGMVLGLLPSLINPISILIILILILVDVNLATAIFSFAIFSGIAYLADPLFHSLGYLVLVDAGWLRGFWTTLYNAPVIPFTNFYNTIVMGSLLIALLLLFPVYWGTKKFIVYYRTKYEPRVQNLKWIKYVKSTAVYNWYEKLKFLGD